RCRNCQTIGTHHLLCLCDAGPQPATSAPSGSHPPIASVASHSTEASSGASPSGSNPIQGSTSPAVNGTVALVEDILPSNWADSTGPVYIPTLCLEISGISTEERIRSRAMLDSGSATSFITEDVVRKLHLTPYRTKPILIKVF